MTERSAFEQPSKAGLNRRDLFQAVAAGAAVSGAIGSTALAQEQKGMTQKELAPGISAVASAADYVRDPTRWGSPEIAALFPGFQHLDMRTSGAVIRLRMQFVYRAFELFDANGGSRRLQRINRMRHGVRGETTCAADENQPNEACAAACVLHERAD